MSLISPNFAVVDHFFPNFGQGPFPEITGKSPELFYTVYFLLWGIYSILTLDILPQTLCVVSPLVVLVVASE